MPETDHAKPIRILQYNYRFCVEGGVEQVLRDWYEHINKTQFLMDFAILSADRLDTAFEQKVAQDGRIFLVGPKQKELNFLARISFYFSLFNQLRNGHYDIFQAHESTPVLLLHCFIAKLAGAKKIYILAHQQGAKNLPGPLKKLRSFLLKLLTNRYFAVSKLAGEALFDQQPFTCLYNGIDTARFAFDPQKRQQIRKYLGMENNLVCGFVGRFSRAKNLLFLLDVFNVIHQIEPSAKLVLVGAGNMQDAISQKIAKLGLQNHVLLTGVLADTNPFYQAFDLFLFPSIHEGFPLVHLEAQSSGLPCFIGDTITDETSVCNTHVISFQKSPKEWAEIILSEMKNFQRTDGTPLIKQAGFDIQTTIKKLEQIYTQP